jgi:hypothetical protein
MTARALMVVGTSFSLDKIFTSPRIGVPFGEWAYGPASVPVSESLAGANTCNWTGLGGIFANAINPDSIFGRFDLLIHAACGEPRC